MTRIKMKKILTGLKPYDPKLFSGKYKLDANENSFDLPKGIKRKIFNKMSGIQINRYPDPACGKLRSRLSKKLGFSEKNIFTGNGSDEIILNLMLAFIEKGDSVVIPVPSFEMYPVIARVCGANVINVPLTKSFDIDDARIINKINKVRAKFVFLAYPNNPTSNCFSESKVMNIIKNAGAFVVIDEAYYEFSGKTFIDAVKRYDNVIVTRTFSKAYSMAGLRVGYAAASQDIVAALNTVRLPYNINSLSQFIALEAMKYTGRIQQSIADIIMEREKMYPVIRRKFDVIKSDANFLFLKINKPQNAKKLFKKRGISIRMFDTGPARGWSRITVGKPVENREVLRVLNKLK